MNKLGIGITIACTSVLSFIGGVLTRSRRQEQEAQKIKNELCKVIGELQKDKELLVSKDEEISMKIDEALETERERWIDDKTRMIKKIKSLELQLSKDEKTNKTTP